MFNKINTDTKIRSMPETKFNLIIALSDEINTNLEMDELRDVSIRFLVP